MFILRSVSKTPALGTVEVNNGGKISVMDANHVILEDAPDRVEHEVLISKTDLGGTELAGAYIVVKDADGKVVDEWESTTKAHVLSLPEGTYTMVETVAPKGYKQVTTEIRFTVDKDGKVTLLTTKVDNGGRVKAMDGNHVVLEDAPEPVDVPGTEQKKTTTNVVTPPSTTRRVVTTPSTTSVSRATSTGDSSNAALWIALAAAAAAAIAGMGVMIGRRRRHEDE